jgi:hypothetical protein
MVDMVFLGIRYANGDIYCTSYSLYRGRRSSSSAAIVVDKVTLGAA